jgi:hypothetical protein
MEHFESDDSKMQLLKRSALQREALHDEVKLISAQTEKVITNALIIGGALAATYFLVRQFSGSKTKRRKSKKIRLVTGPAAEEESVSYAEPQTPGIVSQLGTAIASQAGVFLLDLAKEKLSEYLQSQAQKKHNA